MAIMALTLLVYNVAQHHLRKKLIETHATIRNQLEKPTQKPTLRWVFQTTEGIHEVVMRINATVHCVMTGLTDLRKKIIGSLAQRR